MIGLVPNVECSRDKDGRVTVHWPEGATATVISRELLDEMVEDMNARRWIPVSERLPEEEQEVLVWNGGGQCLKPWQGHVLCEYRNGEWRESQESDLYPGITHWMKLPEPPANYPELS